MKLNLNLDYITKPLSDGTTQPGREISCSYIEAAFISAFEHGFGSGSQRRVHGRIQRKLDAAMDGKLDSIELEKAEFDLIMEAFKGAKFPANLDKYVVILEDELESLKNIPE